MAFAQLEVMRKIELLLIDVLREQQRQRRLLLRLLCEEEQEERPPNKVTASLTVVTK